MKIRELLHDETKWTQGAFAKDANGASVTARMETATRWCVLGAIEKCYGCNCISVVRMNLILRAASALFGINPTLDDFVEWHDAPTTSFDMVRQVIVRASV